MDGALLKCSKKFEIVHENCSLESADIFDRRQRTTVDVILITYHHLVE